MEINKIRFYIDFHLTEVKDNCRYFNLLLSYVWFFIVTVFVFR